MYYKITILLIILFSSFVYTSQVIALSDEDTRTRITNVQSGVPSWTPTVEIWYDQKWYVGEIISNIFNASQRIKSSFIVAFRDILWVSYQNNIPKWNGQIFRPWTMYDVSGNIGIATSSISSGLKLDVEWRVWATEYCDENGNNCFSAISFPAQWYQANNQECSNFCSSRWLSNIGDPLNNNALCTSGENTFSSITNIVYTYGTWGWYQSSPTASVWGMCYRSWQPRDNDGTDITTGCFCSGWTQVWSNQVSGAIPWGSSVWTQSASWTYLLSSDVWIGTSTPLAQMHATWIWRLDGGLQVDGRRAISNTNVSHTARHTNDTHYGFFEVRNNSDQRWAYLGWGNGSNRVNLHIDAADTLNISGGNVGINTNDPQARLHVNGRIIANSPIENNHVATKAYVDSAISSGSSGGSCWATTITNGGCTFDISSAGHAQMRQASYLNPFILSGGITAQCYNGTWNTISVGCTDLTSNNEPTCYIAGTKVTMADGSKKNIEDVVIGEQVLGADGNINTVLGYDRPQLWTRLLYSFNGGPYFVTSEHPFKTTDGWKSIDVNAFIAENPSLVEELQVTTLRVGDEIIMEDGTTTLITSIESRAEADQMLYNFNLDGDNVYFADGYMTHNKPGDSQ